MKITKYRVNFKRKGSQGVVYSEMHNTKESAMKSIKANNVFNNCFVAELDEEVVIELYCDDCERDLKIGDEYILVDDYTRYCSDCYEENSFTYYTVGGDMVGDENDVRIFGERYKEVQHD